MADAPKLEESPDGDSWIQSHLASRFNLDGNRSASGSTLPGTGAEYAGDLSGASLLSFARGEARPKKDDGSVTFDNRDEMTTVIKKKEEDLKRKLKIKQNLRKIEKQVDDKRFADVAEYLCTVARQHKDFFSDPLSANTNIKNIVRQKESLTRKEKNTIFQLHNTASEDETYGSRLYNYCQELVDRGKVDSDFPNQIYVLSVDWPLDFAVDLIPKSKEL